MKRNPETTRGGAPAWAALCLSALATLAGCRNLGNETESAAMPTDQVALLMRGFNHDFSTEIQSIADRVVATNEDPAAQRAALVWKMRLIPLAKSFLDHPNARVAFVDTWVLCVQARNAWAAATTGDTPGHIDVDGRGAASLDRLVDEIESIGATFLSQKDMDEARKAIHTFADSHEVGVGLVAYYSLNNPKEPLGAFMTGLVTKPLTALNPFAGVSETAVAIHEVSRVASLFRDALLDLPDVLRWQTELTLHDTLHSPEFRGALADIDQVAESATRVSLAAERLPAELRETLDQAQGTIDSLGPVMASAVELTQGFNAAGATWVATFGALEHMVASFTPAEDPAAPPKEAGRPFDIREYTETAERLTATAAELRELLVEVRAVAGGAEIGNVASSVDETARSTIDHLILRVGELLLVLLAGAVLLRAVWSRTARARVAPGPTPALTPHRPEGMTGFKRP